MWADDVISRTGRKNFNVFKPNVPQADIAAIMRMMPAQQEDVQQPGFAASFGTSLGGALSGRLKKKSGDDEDGGYGSLLSKLFGGTHKGKGTAEMGAAGKGMPFGGYRGQGGTMLAGRRYRVGSEDVLMNRDGTADVIPSDDPVARGDQVAQEDGTISGTVSEPTLAMRKRASDSLLERIQGIQNREKDTKGGWKDIFKGIGLGALEGIRHVDPRQGLAAQLGGALGGAAAGGGRTAANPDYDDQMWADRKLERLVPQYEQQYGVEQKRDENAVIRRLRIAQAENLEAQPNDRDLDRQRKEKASQAVSERARMNIQFRKGEAKPFIDEQGKVWKQFLKDPSRPMEPLENPITHEQEFVPGEQGIQWYDPVTKQPVTIKAKQSVQPDATITTNKERIALGMARLKLSEDQFKESKRQFDQTFKLRQDAQKSLDDARTRGDENAQKRYQLALDNYDRQIEQMRQYLYVHKDDMDPSQFDTLDQFFVKVPLGAGAATGSVDKP